MTIMYCLAATVARFTPRSIAFTINRRPTFAAVNQLYMSTVAMETNRKVPITLLSGFLGSGKTSTLQHLLENTEGVKIGVIVNDMASVNIDAKLVSETKKDGVIELQNGCACCSLADEFLVSIGNLLGGEREFDAVIVELSGVADPEAIKSNWVMAKSRNHPVTEQADFSRVVTLVDASTFGTDFMTWDRAGERENWVDPTDDCGSMRKVPELLSEQVEAANVILLNKIDLAGADQVKVASSLVKSMNDKATIEEVEYGRVLPQTILRQIQTENADQKSECCQNPNCSSHSHEHEHEHNHDHDHDHSSTATDNLGITSFVYRADRPFNMRKLMPVLNTWPVPIKNDLDVSLLSEAQEGGYEVEGYQQEASPFVGVLRSKGFCWFAPTRWEGNNEDTWRHDTAMYWSHAGKQFGISVAGKWWGSITQEQMKSHFKDDLDEYERILKDDFVSEEFSDRRQELVFIGVNLDEELISSTLDQCLLTDKGMERYRSELANLMGT